MTISINDKRLLTGKKRVLQKLEKLELERDEAQTVIEMARQVMTDSIDEYRRAINREGLTDEVRKILKEPRGHAGDALVRVYYALKQQYAERRARGRALTDQDKKVETFIRNLSPSEYVSASFPTAVSSLERAIDFASQSLPDELVDLSQTALDRANRARGRLEELGERALRAYSDLEDARETAKSNYLAVRELISASFRLTDRYNELDGIAPPINEIMAA